MSNFALYYELSDESNYRNMIIIENETCEQASETFKNHLLEKHGNDVFDVLYEYWVVSSSEEADDKFCAIFDEKYEFERYE